MRTGNRFIAVTDLLLVLPDRFCGVTRVPHELSNPGHVALSLLIAIAMEAFHSAARRGVTRPAFLPKTYVLCRNSAYCSSDGSSDTTCESGPRSWAKSRELEPSLAPASMTFRTPIECRAASKAGYSCAFSIRTLESELPRLDQVPSLFCEMQCCVLCALPWQCDSIGMVEAEGCKRSVRARSYAQ